MSNDGNQTSGKEKSPEELKMDELEQVSGGLVGDDIGQPLATGKGGPLGYQSSGHSGDIAPKISPEGIRGNK